MSEGNLTDRDHNELDDMLRRVLRAFKAGEITEQSVVSCLAHVIAAVDINNPDEARKWFRQNGVDYFKETDNAGRG